MAHPILCSTGAIVNRANGRDPALIMKYAPLLHCDGMEFMMYSTWYPDYLSVARELAASGIPFPAMHIEKSVGDRVSRDQGSDTEDAVRDFALNCEVADIIGAKQLVLHLWGNVDSDRHIEHNLRVFGRLLEIARAHGLELTVENVVCSHVDPMTHLRALRDAYPDAAFTIDTKMAEFHRQLPLFSQPEWAWLWREKRVKHLHINDYRGAYMDWTSLKTLFIGDGQIDFAPFFETAGRWGYEGSLTCECTAVRPDGSVDVERLNESLDKVREMTARFLD